MQELRRGRVPRRQRRGLMGAIGRMRRKMERQHRDAPPCSSARSRAAQYWPEIDLPPLRIQAFNAEVARAQAADASPGGGAWSRDSGSG